MASAHPEWASETLREVFSHFKYAPPRPRPRPAQTPPPQGVGCPVSGLSSLSLCQCSGRWSIPLLTHGVGQEGRTGVLSPFPGPGLSAALLWTLGPEFGHRHPGAPTPLATWGQLTCRMCEICLGDTRICCPLWVTMATSWEPRSSNLWWEASRAARDASVDTR